MQIIITTRFKYIDIETFFDNTRVTNISSGNTKSYNLCMYLYTVYPKATY